MRVVLDTNVIVSALLWGGPPRAILRAARDGRVELVTCPAFLDELQDVLSRPKFAERLSRANVNTAELVHGFGALASIVAPATIEPVVAADPDDDVVLACAVAADAGWICSGDRHLLDLGIYGEIAIVSAAEFLLQLPPEDSSAESSSAP